MKRRKQKWLISKLSAPRTYRVQLKKAAAANARHPASLLAKHPAQ